MLRHLRLARARGSLVAPNSPVQDRAVEILEVVEEFARESQRADRVKALMSLKFADEDRIRAFWPEYFDPIDPFAGAVDEDGDYDIDKVDDSKVEWRTPTSVEEDDEISRWIAQQEQQSVSAADMDF